MAKKYHVMLTDEQRHELKLLSGAGKASARKILHARILLKADASAPGPACSDSQISKALEVDVTTIERIRKRFCEQGLSGALLPKKPDRDYSPKIDEHVEKVLIATACGEPPDGRSRWTLRLLADKLVQLHLLESVSHECVRQVMKKK